MRLRSRIATALGVFVLAAAGPALAQVDVSGEWGAVFHEDLPHRGGMRLGDYTGLPLNEAGQRKAASWDEAMRSIPEWQCIPHVVTYAMRGPATIRFSKVVEVETGRLIAYSLVGSYGRPRTIWMDGREHPSDLAPHTWAGFSTGTWQRNTLVVRTTHIKAGWLQRNGAPTSDLATMTEHFTRYGDHLQLVSFVDDPVFLSEPFIRTTNYEASPAANANAWGVCTPAQVVNELPGREKHYVPHYLPAQRQHIDDFLKSTGIPAAGAAGGRDTTYPEFAVALQQGGKVLGSNTTPGPREAPRTLVPAQGEIRVHPVQGTVYLLAGAGGNIAVQVGRDGVLLVDTGVGAMSDKILSAVRALSDKPIRYIVNTHAHADHIGGNEAIAKAGSRPGGGLVVAGPGGTGASVIAHEEVLFAVSAPTGETPPMPVGAWPTDAYPGDEKELFANGEAIQLLHQPAAHTDGDSIVFFRRSDVIVTGDLLDLTRYPMIDEKRGGTFSGVLAGLNRIMDLAIPENWEEGGTMIVPGQGRVADEADVMEYRNMVTIVRDRIADMIRRGMTVAQVKAARPTLEYDGRYGATTGEWTTDMFVEAAYRDLARGQK
jgi:glyoxylase-like metal-dependent hydrolase (beta-lactamase superfamily II)